MLYSGYYYLESSVGHRMSCSFCSIPIHILIRAYAGTASYAKFRHKTLVTYKSIPWYWNCPRYIEFTTGIVFIAIQKSFFNFYLESLNMNEPLWS